MQLTGRAESSVRPAVPRRRRDITRVQRITWRTAYRSLLPAALWTRLGRRRGRDGWAASLPPPPTPAHGCSSPRRATRPSVSWRTGRPRSPRRTRSPTGRPRRSRPARRTPVGPARARQSAARRGGGPAGRRPGCAGCRCGCPVRTRHLGFPGVGGLGNRRLVPDAGRRHHHHPRAPVARAAGRRRRAGMSFTGFPDEGWSSTRASRRTTASPTGPQHKAAYDEHVRGAMQALVEELTAEFGPGKLFRPYRDVRFAKDKTPYKTHQGACCTRGGRRRRLVRGGLRRRSAGGRRELADAARPGRALPPSRGRRRAGPRLQRVARGAPPPGLDLDGTG